MAGERYVERINGFITPYLKKNGYSLIRTEFVSEDHNWYLRLYIDLTEAEMEKRRQEALAEAASEAELSEEQEMQAAPGAEQEAQQAESPEAAETEEGAEDAETPEEPGVSINDCVKVSRYLSKWLDKEDFIKETYTMEVCSKGFLEETQTAGEEGESE